MLDWYDIVNDYNAFSLLDDNLIVNLLDLILYENVELVSSAFTLLNKLY